MLLLVCVATSNLLKMFWWVFNKLDKTGLPYNTIQSLFLLLLVPFKSVAKLVELYLQFYITKIVTVMTIY